MKNLKKGNFFDRLKNDRQTQLTTILIVLGVVFLVAVVGYFVMRGDSKEDSSSEQANTEAGQEYRRLDGKIAAHNQENEFPVGVMIENLKSVRPQAGLSEAGVVYEALAEGGITRFLAVFAGDDVEKIGPVRSARSYFVDYAKEYNLLYAHCGGSPQALAEISAENVLDVNQIGGDQGYYWRDDNLVAPHNLFTKTELLSFALRDKGVNDETPSYQGWKFEGDPSESGRPSEEKSIRIDFSREPYLVEYKYDAEKNAYARYNGGMPHVDQNNEKQLSPKNVAVQYVEQEVIDGEGRLEIGVVGEGQAVLFSDGQAVTGSWKKEDLESRTIYYDDQGQEYTFTRGQTFIEIVPKDREVEYN